MLVAIEGLDQSGKETQAQILRDSIRAVGHKSRVVSFPDYGTSIGEEIARALQGEREYGPETMQLLYVANRFERKTDIERWNEAGLVVLFDRYVSSSVAYGEAHGLDPQWLTTLQVYLPQPELTLLLDITPETAVARKAVSRDRYEQDLSLLQRVRESYLRQAEHQDWVRVDGEQSKDRVASDLAMALKSRLASR
tara:strand:- start:84 stop:668 length:585 start_codon:yes stop_codon:yes gene_type:complete